MLNQIQNGTADSQTQYSCVSSVQQEILVDIFLWNSHWISEVNTWLNKDTSTPLIHSYFSSSLFPLSHRHSISLPHPLSPLSLTHPLTLSLIHLSQILSLILSLTQISHPLSSLPLWLILSLSLSSSHDLTHLLFPSLIPLLSLSLSISLSPSLPPRSPGPDISPSCLTSLEVLHFSHISTFI